MRKYFTVLIMLINISVIAQTPVPINGSFTVNSETFNCSDISYVPNTFFKSISIINSRIIHFSTTANYSSTCTPLERKKEMNRYSFQKNKQNAMQMVAILRTVFSPQRCAQLGNKHFDLGVSIFPNTNAINCTDYVIWTEGTDTYVTQEEIAQLDHLIRTTTNFTFPKIKGTCSTVGSISLNGIDFKFNELYTNPWLNGTDSLWDDDQQRTD